jgi:Ankyrin repeats (3 copies)
MASQTSFGVDTFKDRSSIGTASTGRSSSADDADHSDGSDISDIHEEDLSEFDDLEKELLRFSSRSRLDSNPKLSTRTSGSSVDPKPTTPKSGRGAASPLHAEGLENRLQSRMQRALSNNFYHQSGSQCGMVDQSERVDQQTPDECLRVILQGVSASTFKSETWEGYFTAITSERLSAYRLQVSQAIRADALWILKELHSQGMPLDGCNAHGESMIHLACRLGRLEIVKFLVHDANVSIRVCDDAGRTPLHDACWTNKPNFDLMHFVLDKSPELLFITDKRNFTAFGYIPSCCREEWCEFLQDKQAFLRCKVNHSGYLKASDQLDEAQERLRALMRRAAMFE